MKTVEVETNKPHQYRQQDRSIGERYEADEIHLSLLLLLGWARLIEVKADPVMVAKAVVKRNARPR